MTVELTHAEAELLLGVYALDAVEPDESRALEAHLKMCEVCRNELAQHTEIVGVLVGDGETPPEGLWNRVAQKLEEQPPPLREVWPPNQAHVNSSWRRSRSLSVSAVVTTVAAIVVSVVGVSVIQQNNELTKIEKRLSTGNLHATAIAASGDPLNRHYVLSSPDGKYKVDSVITPEGNGFITGGNLPNAGDGRSYQLWAVTGTEAISLGMMGDEAEVVAFQLPTGTSALALTNEVSNGVVKSEEKPIVVGALTT